MSCLGSDGIAELMAEQPSRDRATERTRREWPEADGPPGWDTDRSQWRLPQDREASHWETPMPTPLAPKSAPIPTELTIQQAVAAGYGSDATIRRKIKAGELPARTVGRTYLIPRADLEALRLHTRSETTSDPVDLAIQRLVDAAPAMSPVQLRELASVLGGVTA